jgi:hypothetical protein
MNFNQALNQGKIGESVIAGYMRGKGYNVLPAYEKVFKEYKGPTLFLSQGGSLISPDMLAFNNDKVFWIEAKHKSAFCWNRSRSIWTTGIDRHHFNQYLEVDKNSAWPVWLLFLHSNGVAKDTPQGKVSPTGLFGGEIGYLNDVINHESEAYGMVYWNHADLKKLSDLKDLKKALEDKKES